MLKHSNIRVMESRIADLALSNKDNPLFYFGDIYMYENRVVHASTVVSLQFTELLLTDLYRAGLIHCVRKDYPLKYPKHDERTPGLLARMHSTGNTEITLNKGHLYLSTYDYLDVYRVSGISKRIW
jgi:hypothetical protein